MKTKLLVLGLVAVAFILRFYTLPQNLFFAFEQGRDLEVVKSIAVNHKLTLIGPRTSIDGVFHGVFYYYLMVLPFIIARGNPIGLMAFFILWQSLGVCFLFFLLYKAVNKRTALIGSVLYATSYGLIVYSRWFSHPPQIIPFSLLYFLSLWKITKDRKYYLLALFSWAAIFHLDLMIAIFFVPATLVFLFCQKPLKPSYKIVFGSAAILLLFFASYILFEIRHNFLMLKSLENFLAAKHGLPQTSLALSHFWFRITAETTDLIAPDLFVPALALFFAAFLWLLIKKNKNAFEKLLLLWLISIPSVGIFFSPYFGLKHYLIGVGPAVLILTACFLNRLWQGKTKIAAVVILFFAVINNLYLIADWLPKNRNVFYLFPQPGMVLQSQQKVLDYIYRDQSGNNFGWEAFTLPYFSADGWKYLFEWYGLTKYNYVPGPLKKGEYFYVIIEPGADKLFLNNWLKDTMDKRGRLVSEKFIGTIRVQKRNTIH
ncbi:MAG: glycosyltransferase family 39 protein [Patescibacteria group bacterium]|nr:glycosyltransferase family 39 protein [Patescibacteria group bacterium]